MPILVAAILIPTLTFYSYALFQFWTEMRRRRHPQLKIVELKNFQVPEDEFEPFPERKEVAPEPEAPTAAEQTPLVFPANKVAIISGAGRVAFGHGSIKHVAKG
jgi:hypothetical protein